MKAALYTGHGGPEHLQVMEHDTPTAMRGEVVIQVRAAALNHLDIWIRKGRPGLELLFPHVPGSDCAGTIAALGPGVTTCNTGDEVLVNPGLSCNHCARCDAGEHSECDAFTILGMGRPGSFAEFVAVPAENVFPKPPHLSWEEAAALPLAHLTAWRMLFHRAHLRAGEKVLIHGIGGGVALAALQLAKLAGASVIVTSSSDEKLDTARRLGADAGVNYAFSKDLPAAIRAAAHGEMDVIVDTVGAGTWPTNIEVARKGARIVHCGVTTGGQFPINLSTIYWKQLSILGSTMGSRGDFRALLTTVETHQLRPLVDRAYPLAEARAAQNRMESGRQFGKLVLTP
jgi:NADPH:quinone reductase-like Zn-dependent oxidoreductase